MLVHATRSLHPGCVRGPVARSGAMSASFRIQALPVGGEVLINGEDVTDRAAVTTIRLGHTEPTIVTLHMIGEGTIEGEGIVHIQDDLADVPQLVVDFLAQVSPEQLEQDALMAHQADESLTATMLRVLAGYATGAGT